ncbi:MAG: hypothetical protein JWN67_2995 [Actinomycetia bacterium]|nr:hypothetical protein [Actinomycetes bacterium]
MHFPLRRSSALLLPVLLVAAVACSDGGKEKDAAATTTSTAEAQPLGADQVDASASPYCAVWAEIRKAGGVTLTGDEAKDSTNLKEHYTALVPTAEDLVAKAPDEIVEAAKAALAQVKDVAESGSPAGFAAHGGSQVPKQLTAYAAAHCAKD